MVRPNHNVHVSINRRIEMPPAFHFPEDQIPPSDLVGLNNHDSPDNAQAVSGAYRLVVTLARTDLLYMLNWGTQWTMVS